ncbi:MAG: hypothetical protein ABJA86_12060, partial [Nocardioidaceae bacterium]
TPHALVDGQYADRRSACHEAARRLGIAALRDLVVADMPVAGGQLDDEVMARRVRHVVTENARVLAVSDFLRSGRDPREIGALLTESHASLRDDYEVRVRRVDVIVESAIGAGARGARLTGGGFGGCAIVLTDADRAEAVIARVRSAFSFHQFGRPDVFRVNPSAGASGALDPFATVVVTIRTVRR